MGVDPSERKYGIGQEFWEWVVGSDIEESVGKERDLWAWEAVFE